MGRANSMRHAFEVIYGMTTTTFNAEVAIEQYVERARVNANLEHVNNGRLYAGSPMHYYCKFCREPTETLPESHLKQPKTACDPCKALNDHGLIPKAKRAFKETG